MTKEPMAVKQKKKVKNAKNRCVRPGALTQVCRKPSSKNCTDIGKKRVVVDSKKAKSIALPQNDLVNNSTPMQSPDRISIIPMAGTGRLEWTPTQLSSPQQPFIPSCGVGHMNPYSPFGRLDRTKQHRLPRTPKTPQSEECNSQSGLECLPTDILVKIICHLHHDQLRAVFHVSKRIRTAVLRARQLYFNFTTPDRSRQEMLNTRTPLPTEHWPFVSKEEGRGFLDCCPQTPKAPKHVPRVPQPPPTEINQISAVLFPDSVLPTRAMGPPGLPKSAWKSLASNRVLFCEEELCHAVAQNKLR